MRKNREGLELTRCFLDFTAEDGQASSLSFDYTGGALNLKETGRAWALYGVDPAFVRFLAGNTFAGVVLASAETGNGRVDLARRQFESPTFTYDKWASSNGIMIVDNCVRPVGFLGDDW